MARSHREAPRRRLWILTLVVFLASCVEGVREPTCVYDDECDDGNPCTGVEVCTPAGVCGPGEPVVCPAPQQCFAEADEARCDALCPLPRAPLLQPIADAETLEFRSDAEFILISEDGGGFGVGTSVTLAGWSGSFPIRAHPSGDLECEFSHNYQVQQGYPGPAESERSSAITADDSRIQGWAANVVGVSFGTDVDASWRTPEAALGPAEGADAVVPLGRGGHITLELDPPAADGPGADLAVFENGFDDTFLELGFVEVSSDGTVFARFDNASLTKEPVGAFGTVNPSAIHGFAGTVRRGYGATFDLSLLRFHDAVRTGQLDLDYVRYVRIIDVVGDGSARDSFGRPIYDPFPTVGTAGFDLDGVAVLETNP